MPEVTPLSYDVVMATRNRPEAVALSVPLILAQTRLPARLIIVDSSDDGTEIARIAEKAAATPDVEVRYLRGAQGLTLQRNVGLGHCRSDVVVFPDDDSLLYPDTAETMMAIYEADPGRAIAGVCATPEDAPPPDARDRLGKYEAERIGRAGAVMRGLRQRVKEAAEGTNPFLSVGNRLNAAHAAAVAALPAGQAAAVPYMTGFRMSFRREVIDTVRFDETLRRYAWFEDIDASWGAMGHGAVVVAKAARIYHHRVAAARDNGERMGRWAILNRGYVVMKAVHANPLAFPDPAREARRLKLYCRGRALAYRAMARDTFGRDRARGAAEALSGLDRLVTAAPDGLAACYRHLNDD